jgi:hypothetical protein
MIIGGFGEREEEYHAECCWGCQKIWGGGAKRKTVAGQRGIDIFC